MHPSRAQHNWRSPWYSDCMTQDLLTSPLTDKQISQLADEKIVRPLVHRFKRAADKFAQQHGGTQMHFENVEEWVFDNVNDELAAEIITREPEAAKALYVWIRDDGLGAWSELREENPDQYGPAAAFQSAVASWLHDIIGAPLPEDPRS